MTSVPDSPRRLRLRVAVKLMAWLALGFAVVVGLTYIAGGAERGGRAQPSAKRVDVAGLALGQSRTVLWQGRRVIAVRTGSGGDERAEPTWTVVFARDPIRGCPVAWQPREGVFASSCASARYGADGRRLPAGEGERLERPPYRITDAGVLVLGEIS